MSDVGTISILSHDAKLIEKVSLYLDLWLTKNEWKKAVSLSKKSRRNKTETLLEVTFIPGEYQSNGQRRLVFKNKPELKTIENELKQWLFNIMD